MSDDLEKYLREYAKEEQNGWSPYKHGPTVAALARCVLAYRDLFYRLEYAKSAPHTGMQIDHKLLMAFRGGSTDE